MDKITNYVVMNETANATLALGALAVMANAQEEVAEMVGLAGALVLNIGTLSEPWVDAMLLAGKAANERGIPVVLDPVGAGATAYRTETARRLLDEIDVTVCAGTRARSRRSPASRRRCAASSRSVTAATRPSWRGRRRRASMSSSVTGPVDHVSDGERRAGRERTTAARFDHGHGLHVDRDDGLLPRRQGRPFEAAVEALVAFGVAGEDAAVGAKGPGSFHVGSTTRSQARPGDADRAGEGRDRMRLHALVADEEQRPPCGGGRRDGRAVAPEGRPTAEVVALGKALDGLGPELIVNDDVDAALELGVGVHLGQGDPGIERAPRLGSRSGSR